MGIVRGRAAAEAYPFPAPLLPASSIAAREYVDQFGDLAPLLTLITRSNRVLDAMRHVIGENFFLGLPQRRPRCRELGDDIDAVAVILDHARQAAHLPLDPFEAFEHR